MEEKFMTNLTELISTIARNVAKEAVKEEMTKILDNAARPGKLLSDLIDYNQACKLLNVSKPTLHSYIKVGKLTKHFVVEGGKPYLSKQEIEKMMKKSRRMTPNLTIERFMGKVA